MIFRIYNTVSKKYIGGNYGFGRIFNHKGLRQHIQKVNRVHLNYSQNSYYNTTDYEIHELGQGTLVRTVSIKDFLLEKTKPSKESLKRKITNKITALQTKIDRLKQDLLGV